MHGVRMECVRAAPGVRVVCVWCVAVLERLFEERMDARIEALLAADAKEEQAAPAIKPAKEGHGSANGSAWYISASGEAIQDLQANGCQKNCEDDEEYCDDGEVSVVVAPTTPAQVPKKRRKIRVRRRDMRV